MIASLFPRALALALALSGVALVNAQETGFDVPAALHELVDLDDPAARTRRAAELSKADVDIETWLDAMRAFAPRGAGESGMRRLRVPLWNGTEPEETELFVFAPATEEFTEPLALMLVAHGTGGSGNGLPGLWANAASDVGMVVVAPSEAGANDGYHYAERERQIALAAIRWARRAYRIDPDRVFLSGISRGGHLTWDVALRQPDHFAGLAPMIGGPRLNPGQAQNNLRYLDNIAHLSIRDLQGALDDPHLVANLRVAFRKLEKLGAHDAVLHEFPDRGHDFDFDAVDWVAWLRTTRRVARPDRVLRSAARKGEGRAFWCEILGFDLARVREEPSLSFPAATWEKLDETGRRAKVQELLDSKTARLEAILEAPGRIKVSTTLVKQFRVLLTPEMCDDKGKLALVWNGRTKRTTLRPDRAVLLAEFAERFDPTFLPIATLVVP